MSWALSLGVLVRAAVRAVQWFVLCCARHTRWGRPTRTGQGLRRARDALLERCARGEITEDGCRERLPVLEDEGRAGP